MKNALVVILLLGLVGMGVWMYWEDQNLRKQIQELTDTNAAAGTGTQPAQLTDATVYHSAHGIDIRIDAPLKDGRVASPLGIIGQVPGSWSFEASFPIVLQDDTGKTLAQTTGKVLGDWMTSELTPFSASLNFDQPTSATGQLILKKENPSGQADRDDQVVLPVRFR